MTVETATNLKGSKRILKQRWILVLGFCLWSLGGCGKPEGELFPPPAEPIFWPAPPEKPRIKYIGQLSTEQDLKKAVSPWENLTQTLFGKDKIGVLLNPFVVTVDHNQRLFIADTTASAVHMMDLNTRQYQQFSSLAYNQNLISPVALSMVEDRLYVADSSLHQICVFDRDGEFVFSFGQELLQRPSGIAYDSSRQQLYVCDAVQHRIFIFNPGGQYLKQIGQRGVKPGEFNFPTQLWVDFEGNVYVSDTLNYRIAVFSPDGNFQWMFGEQGDRPGNLAHPSGVAVDSYGHIYVVDKQFENIQIFDREGSILMAFGQEGNQIGQFWLPAGIWIDKDDIIYIADSFNKRIQIFELLKDLP